MPEKDQIFIFTKRELSFIKNIFSENDVFLYTIRKVLFQFPMTDAEKEYIKKYVSKEVLTVLKKKLMPELSNEYPIGQLTSVLMTLQNSFSVKQDEDMEWQFDAKQLEISYIKQQLAVLEDIDAPQDLKLQDMATLSGTPKERYVNITAYMFLVGFIDPVLFGFKVLAGAKDESPEDQAKRLTKDSNK